ncbi:ABC transporter F family member [Trifolium repens]|nr:ABC transporter F family member [Trifolium repens]
MEFEGEDGSTFPLQTGDKFLFGRGFGFNTDDHTVSRRHISFQLNESDSESPRVSFQVIGRNPIWVLKNNDETLKLFRKFDKGQLELGDRFCLSGKTPIWFNFNKNQDFECEIDFDQLDVSQFDPVKEFGFLVMKHEFDQYPKGMLRNAKNWDWFLEEPSKESEDEDDSDVTRKIRGKRKVFKDNEDDEWTCDSEDDKDLVAKMGKGKKPRYSTRSKDKRGSNSNVKASNNSKRQKATSGDETDDDDDDETLGGFIVTDDEDEDEEQNNDDDDDEEEFEEEDDDDAVAG